MKAGLILTGNGAMVYLTSHSHCPGEELIAKFEMKGIDKFVAWELPVDKARKRYGRHFDIVLAEQSTFRE